MADAAEEPTPPPAEEAPAPAAEAPAAAAAEAPKPAEAPAAEAPAAPAQDAPPAAEGAPAPAAAAAAPEAAAEAAAPAGPPPPPVDEVLHKKFRAVFSLFELESKTMRNMCDERELATLVRSLGYNPTQAHLRELLVDIRGDEQPTGYISFDRFERALIRLLEGHRRELLRDTEDKIIAAFRTLDPEGKGYLDPEYVKELLMSRGDQFKSDEMQAMLEAALDPTTNRIYYEDYAAMLADDQAVIPDYPAGGVAA